MKQLFNYTSKDLNKVLELVNEINNIDFENIEEKDLNKISKK